MHNNNLHVTQLIFAILGVLNTAIPLILNSLQIFPEWKWQVHALIGFVVFASMMIWLAHGYYSKLKFILNSKPNIILQRVDENFPGHVLTSQFDPKSGQNVYTHEYPNFTRIWIANDPISLIQQVDANRLYGEISFYLTNSDHPLFSMNGRWAETEEIASGAKIIEIDQLDLPPNRRPFCMDIGLKYLPEDYFYAYNNESPLKNTVGFRDSERKLPVGEYYVQVRFTCKGVDKKFWFKLTNSGKNNPVQFNEIPSPF